MGEEKGLRKGGDGPQNGGLQWCVPERLFPSQLSSVGQKCRKCTYFNDKFRNISEATSETPILCIEVTAPLPRLYPNPHSETCGFASDNTFISCSSKIERWKVVRKCALASFGSHFPLMKSKSVYLGLYNIIHFSSAG